MLREVARIVLVSLLCCCLALPTDAGRQTLQQSNSFVEGVPAEGVATGALAQGLDTETLANVPDNPPLLEGPPGLVSARDPPGGQDPQDAPPPSFSRCGTPEVSDARKARIERQVAMALAQQGVSTAAAAAATTPTVIPTYVWVINSGTGGNPVTCEQHVQSQMSVLNASFASANFAFSLVQCRKLVKDDWFRMGFGTAAEQAAKTSLRVGTAQHLNIYIALPENPDGTNSVLGYSTIPADYTTATAWKDGVVISFRTVPGYTPPIFYSTDFINGDTAVHEVGHFLGLFHIFSPTCNVGSSTGDLVADTPPQLQPTNYNDCTAAKAPDTCKQDKIKDMRNNFMDYRSDACVSTFTAGQIARMQQQWLAFRAGK